MGERRTLPVVSVEDVGRHLQVDGILVGVVRH